MSGHIPQTGFVTTFHPNTRVPYTHAGQSYDIDYGFNTGGTAATRRAYRVITARSHNTGGVNVLFMDGGVRFVTNAIELTTWRSLGTRSGGEVANLP